LRRLIRQGGSADPAESPTVSQPSSNSPSVPPECSAPPAPVRLSATSRSPARAIAELLRRLLARKYRARESPRNGLSRRSTLPARPVWIRVGSAVLPCPVPPKPLDVRYPTPRNDAPRTGTGAASVAYRHRGDAARAGGGSLRGQGGHRAAGCRQQPGIRRWSRSARRGRVLAAEG